jgi:hypothetical protein
MPVFKPRDRIVIFRLTQDEYDSLLAVCHKRGARNLTDFTRSEVLASIERELQPSRTGEAPAIGEKLESLQAAIQHIRTLLEEKLNPPHAHGKEALRD